METIVVPPVEAPERREPARRRARGRSTAAAGPVTYVLLILATLVSVFPLYWTLVAGSHTNHDIAATPPPFLPSADLFHNFRLALEQAPIGKAIVNSVIVAGCITIGTVLCCTLAGFAFAKLRFRGNGVLLALVVGTMMVPTQLGIIPLFIAMSELGWAGHLQAVIVPNLVTAFGVFWMTQYLEQALPYELVEAARVDGASMLRTFWSIALPAARPAATMLALFTFVASWTNYFWPFIVLGSKNPTLPIALQQLQAAYFKDMSLIMAGVVLSVIPLLILFVIAGRQLVAGIMQGAVKG